MLHVSELTEIPQQNAKKPQTAFYYAFAHLIEIQLILSAKFSSQNISIEFSRHMFSLSGWEKI